MGNSELLVISLEIVVGVGRNLENWKVFIFLSPKPDKPKSAIRLKSLNYLLDLENRWQGDLNDGRLEAQLESALRFATEDERASGFQPNIDWIRNKLSYICDVFESGIGKIPNYVPAQAYANWVCNDLEAAQEWFEILLSEINLPKKGPVPLLVEEQVLQQEQIEERVNQDKSGSTSGSKMSEI